MTLLQSSKQLFIFGWITVLIIHAWPNSQHRLFSTALVNTDRECVTETVLSFLPAQQVHNDLLTILLLLTQEVTIKCRSRGFKAARHLYLVWPNLQIWQAIDEFPPAWNLCITDSMVHATMDLDRSKNLTFIWHQTQPELFTFDILVTLTDLRQKKVAQFFFRFLPR